MDQITTLTLLVKPKQKIHQNTDDKTVSQIY